MLGTKKVSELEISDAMLSAPSVSKALHRVRELESAESEARRALFRATEERRNAQGDLVRAIGSAAGDVASDRKYIKDLLREKDADWSHDWVQVCEVTDIESISPDMTPDQLKRAGAEIAHIFKRKNAAVSEDTGEMAAHSRGETN